MFRTVLPGFPPGHRNWNTPVLHWLPINQRIIYKVLLLVHKAINTTGPTYLKDLLTPHFTSRTHRSGNSNLLAVPRPKLTKMGDCAFSSLGPQFWNKLPEIIRALDSFAVFKSHLKTHLYLCIHPKSWLLFLFLFCVVFRMHCFDCSVQNYSIIILLIILNWIAFTI